MKLLLPDAVQSSSMVLRRRRPSDIPELLAAIEISTVDLSAFLGWAAAGVPSRPEFDHVVAARDADFEAGTAFEYVMRDAGTDEVLGEAGGELRTDGIVEIGYWVRSDRTGRGYATAAARELTSLAFNASADVDTVEIRMDKGNVRSRAVATRLGFAHVGDERFEGDRLSGQTGEGHIYAMTRSQWENAR